MPRRARIVVEGIPYHITQRGNGRQQIFFDDYDYRLYADLLGIYADECGLRLWAYCLMPNHVHLVAVPERRDSMASALGRTHAHFARHFNLKRRTCGHVWQARYYSCPLEGAHVWRTIAYVERNPVRAHLVPAAEDHPWSSARLRFGLEHPSDFLHLSPAFEDYTAAAPAETLESIVDEEAFGRLLHEASRRGRPLGDPEFIQDLKRRIGVPSHRRALVEQPATSMSAEV